MSMSKCRNCQYETVPFGEEPCIRCAEVYASQFEPKIPNIPAAEKINRIIDKLDQMTIGMNVWPSEIIKMLEDLRRGMLT